MNYVILTILVLIGIYDIWLAFTDKPTLSQQYQKLLPTWVDIIVLAILLVGLCFLTAIHPAIRIWLAAICGHIIFPNKERYCL